MSYDSLPHYLTKSGMYDYSVHMEPATTLQVVRFDLETYGTDFVPDRKVADTLRAIVHQQDEHLKGLEDEILRLTVRLRNAEAEKAAVHNSRCLHQAFLAPIRKLAPEILGEVFIHCLPVSSTPLPVFDIRLLLLQVCRQWKRIAIGTPRFWTAVGVEAKPRWNPRALVQMCLDNSGLLPIEVTLFPFGWSKECKGTEAMRLLLDNLHRVQQIKGYIGRSFGNELLRREIPVQAPLLKVVQLRGFLHALDDNEIVCLKDVIRTSDLQSLELKGCAQLFTAFSSNPGGLQNLALASNVVDEYTPALLKALPLLANLQSLDLSLPEDMVSIGEEASIVTLPHLRRLVVTNGRNDHICRLLSVLDMPSLEYLTLATNIYEEANTTIWTSLRSSLRGNPPPLQHLTLQDVILQHEGFVDFVSALSSLEYLRFDGCNIKDDHLTDLVLDSRVPRDHMICPRLASLVFKNAAVPGELIVELVRSRAPLPGSPAEDRRLRYVEADKCTGIADYHAGLDSIKQACGGLLEVTFRLVAFMARWASGLCLDH